MRNLAVILALLISFSLAAQPLDEVALEDVGLSAKGFAYADEAIQKQIEAGNLPGAVLAVVKDGAMPYLKAYGKMSYDSNDKMKTTSVFDIASCTKSISTAICAMILMERGELSLRDNLDYFIEDFNKNKYFEQKHSSIYIRNLLTHTSGLPPYVTVDKLKEKYDTLSLNSVVDYAKNCELRYKPGEGFKYSCINFLILQHIIENITGQSLREFAKENIFTPLKMNKTDYLPLGDKKNKAWAKKKDIVPTMSCDRTHQMRGEVNDPLAGEVNNGISGNAGIFSTASDLAILCATILNNGSYNGKQILSPISVRTMTTVPEKLSDYGRALGWDVYSPFSSNMGDLFEQESFGHTGYTGCSITLDKENNMAIILLTNATNVEDYDAGNIVRLRARVANCVASSIMKLP